MAETRTPITDAMKAQIADALKTIPEGKRGAVLLVADRHGVRAHLAARIGDRGDWKVAAGAGFVRSERKQLTGWVGIEGAW